MATAFTQRLTTAFPALQTEECGPSSSFEALRLFLGEGSRIIIPTLYRQV